MTQRDDRIARLAADVDDLAHELVGIQERLAAAESVLAGLLTAAAAADAMLWPRERAEGER